MKQFKIYFSHGKDSGPDGRKITSLMPIAESFGFETESVDYTATKDPEERIKILFDILKNKSENRILYGSSMGAYVSVAVSQLTEIKGLFLCAPALYLENYKHQNFKLQKIPLTIIHGKQDLIVPYENSVKFASEQNCELHLVNDDHILSSSEELIRFLFKQFLRSLK